MLFLNVRHDKIQSQYNDKEITTEWLRLRFVCCVFDMCWVVICIYCCPDPEWRESTGPFYFLIPDIEWYRMQLLSWWSLLCWLDSASPVNDANLKLYQPNGELFRFICYTTHDKYGASCLNLSENSHLTNNGIQQLHKSVSSS